jgi:hypothetical protein
MNSNYDTSPRTLREGVERNKSHDGYLPYLNAPRGLVGGYSSGSWAEDDRRLVLWIKVAFVAAIGGLICIIQTIIAN